MLLYSIILFLVAIPIGAMSMGIYRGNPDLIHDYHREKVTDKAAYGKAFGKAMFVITAAMLLSGVAGLFGSSDTVAMIAVSVLFGGLFIGICAIIPVQKKYNKGIF